MWERQENPGGEETQGPDNKDVRVKRVNRQWEEEKNWDKMIHMGIIEILETIAIFNLLGVIVVYDES